MAEAPSNPLIAGLKGLAWLMLLAGLAVGLIALAAPAGVWLGLWDFRTGFRLLFSFANSWGLAVAIAAALTGIAVIVAGRAFAARGAAKSGVLAIVGALIALAGWGIPESYRPREDVPPIHDISTDTDDPPAFVAVLPLRVDAANTVEYGRSSDMTPDRLAELTRAAYPDLTTRFFPEPPEQIFERALAAVERLGWERVAAVPDEGRIEATDTTFWFRFKDDIVIRIRPADGGSEVDARSVSRVGVGDAGTNARRLRRFFATLSEES